MRDANHLGEQVMSIIKKRVCILCIPSEPDRRTVLSLLYQACFLQFAKMVIQHDPSEWRSAEITGGNTAHGFGQVFQDHETCGMSKYFQ